MLSTIIERINCVFIFISKKITMDDANITRMMYGAYSIEIFQFGITLFKHKGYSKNKMKRVFFKELRKILIKDKPDGFAVFSCRMIIEELQIDGRFNKISIVKCFMILSNKHFAISSKVNYAFNKLKL